MESTLSKPKVFVLLDHLDATAPIHQVVNGQRIRIKKIPVDHAFMQLTFMDNKDKKNKTIRYKSQSNYIYQNEQIKEEGILANEPFRDDERDDMKFKNGVNVVFKDITSTFLLASPECEGFNGICTHVKKPKYKLLDTSKEIKTTNEDLRKRTKAASKILDLELEEAQDMLIRLNGSFFETPDDVEECQNMLIDFLDDAETAGLDAILADEDDMNVDTKTTVLIGKLLNAKLLSFDEVEGKISKKDKDDKWIVIRDMSSSYTPDERKRMFSDFLNTEDGKPLKNDLENDLRELSDNSSTVETYEPKKMGRPKKNL